MFLRMKQFEYYQLIGDELIVNIKMMMGIIE